MHRVGLARFHAIQRAFAAGKTRIRRRLPIDLATRTRRFIDHDRHNARRHQRLGRAHAGRSCADNDDPMHAVFIDRRTHVPVAPAGRVSTRMPSLTKVEHALIRRALFQLHPAVLARAHQAESRTRFAAELGVAHPSCVQQDGAQHRIAGHGRDRYTVQRQRHLLAMRFRKTHELRRGIGCGMRLAGGCCAGKIRHCIDKSRRQLERSINAYRSGSGSVHTRGRARSSRRP